MDIPEKLRTREPREGVRFRVNPSPHDVILLSRSGCIFVLNRTMKPISCGRFGYQRMAKKWTRSGPLNMPLLNGL
jgi:hypothetical protein